MENQFKNDITTLLNIVKKQWSRAHDYPISEEKTEVAESLVWLSDSPYQMLYLQASALSGSVIRPFIIKKEENFVKLLNLVASSNDFEIDELGEYTGDFFHLRNAPFLENTIVFDINFGEQLEIFELKLSIERSFDKKLNS